LAAVLATTALLPAAPGRAQMILGFGLIVSSSVRFDQRRALSCDMACFGWIRLPCDGPPVPTPNEANV
jgi:hypothetical protein